MSTEIKLVGIGPIPVREDILPIPGIVAEYRELGFSGFKHSLRSYAEEEPDVLIPTKDEIEPGVDQYLLADPNTFVNHVRANPHYWDSVGYGFESAIACLEKDLAEGHQLTWWFIIEY